MYVQIETPTGSTWVFQPDQVPPSLVELVEEGRKDEVEKQDKKSVEYSKGMASEHCGICRHFQEPNACELVEGEIAPSYWCKLFANETRGDASPTPRMNELQIARAIANKSLPSPQEYENLWLFALRFTGTGASYRPELLEHVWRDPGIYLNSDFLDRIKGLPVIWEHPPGNELTQEEFESRVIGSIMLPYLEQDEVWAICRIYDQGAAKMMRETQLSTSPSVVFGPESGNQTRKLEGGRTLLIEGEPRLVDHLAVCELGVWDRGGEATGIAYTGTPERAEGMAGRLPMADARVDRIGSALEALRTIIQRL